MNRGEVIYTFTQPFFHFPDISESENQTQQLWNTKNTYTLLKWQFTWKWCSFTFNLSAYEWKHLRFKMTKEHHKIIITVVHLILLNSYDNYDTFFPISELKCLHSYPYSLYGKYIFMYSKSASVDLEYSAWLKWTTVMMLFFFLASVYIHVHYIKIYFTIFRVKKSKKEKRNRETHMEYDNATFLAFFFFCHVWSSNASIYICSHYMENILNLLFRSCMMILSEELTCSIVHESKWTDYCDCCHFWSSKASIHIHILYMEKNSVHILLNISFCDI